MTEKRYNYFVYRQGNPKGYWYSSFEQLDSNKIIPVDSILKLKSTPINLQSIIHNAYYTLFETVQLPDGFVEKYIPKSKPDETYNDTTFLYYSKSMNPIKFSLSPFLDSLTNAKLHKLRIAYNEAYSIQYSITMPQRDIVYEIATLELTNSSKIKSLFQRFYQDEKKFPPD